MRTVAGDGASSSRRSRGARAESGWVSGRSCRREDRQWPFCGEATPASGFTKPYRLHRERLYRLAACSAATRWQPAEVPRRHSVTAVFGLDQFGKHRFVRPASRASPQAGQPVQLVRISPDYPVPARDVSNLRAREPNRRESSGTASLAASPAYEPDAFQQPFRSLQQSGISPRSTRSRTVPTSSCRADGQFIPPLKVLQYARCRNHTGSSRRCYLTRGLILCGVH